MSKNNKVHSAGSHALDRKSTSFAIKLFELLKSLDFSADSPEYSFLKYHQNIARYYVNNVDTESRGVLLFHKMGLGKTILAVSIAMDSIDKYQPIILLTKSLQNNFKRGIAKYMQMRADVDPEYFAARLSDDEIIKWIEKNYSFVSMNASNMIKQMVDATEGSLGKEYKKIVKKQIGESAGDILEKNIENVVTMGNLDNKILIVDEAHNLFRAITNGSKNALQLYDMVRNAKNMKLIFLTGTPISNDPFELVPCFNMLSTADYPLLPEIWKEFYTYFVANGQIKNKSKFQNRIMGLVSYVSHESNPGKGTGKKIESKKVEFPEKLPTIIEFVPMDMPQYVAYQLAREKEMEEGKSYVGKRAGTVPAMQKPKNDTTSSYRQRSRQISNFNIPERFKEMKFSEIPIDQLEDKDLNSPKHIRIYENVMKSPGNGLVYSQFVGSGGLGSFMRFLEKNGWELYPGQKKSAIKSAISREQSANPPERAQSEDIAISREPISEFVKVPNDNTPDDSTASIEKAAQESPDYSTYKVDENINLSPEPVRSDVDFTEGATTFKGLSTDDKPYTGGLSEFVEVVGFTDVLPAKSPDDPEKNEPHSRDTFIGGLQTHLARSQYIINLKNITGGISKSEFDRRVLKLSPDSSASKRNKILPDDVTIRKISPDDIDQVAELYSEIFAEKISKYDLARYAGKKYSEESGVLSGGLVATDSAGRVIGAILYKDHPAKSADNAREITITSVISDSHTLSDILFNKIRDFVASDRGKKYKNINISIASEDREDNKHFYAKYDIAIARNPTSANVIGGIDEEKTAKKYKVVSANDFDDIAGNIADKITQFIEENKTNALTPYHPSADKLRKWARDNKIIIIFSDDSARSPENIDAIVAFSADVDDLAVLYAVFSESDEEIFHRAIAILSDFLASDCAKHARIHIPVSKYKKDFADILEQCGCVRVNEAGEVAIYQCPRANPAVAYIGGFTIDKSDFNLNVELPAIPEPEIRITRLPDNLKGYHQYKEKYYEWPYLNFAVIKKGKKYPLAYLVLKFQEIERADSAKQNADKSRDKSHDKSHDKVQLYIKKFIIADNYINSIIGDRLLEVAVKLFDSNPISRLFAKIKVEKSNIRNIFEENNFKLINTVDGRWIFEYNPAIAISPERTVQRYKRSEARDKDNTTGGNKTGKKRTRYFAFITGAVDADLRQHIQDVYNSRENIYGGVIDLILLSSTGAEGLDLKNVRHEHIMEPYWNWSRIQQIESRGIRNDAHKDLPKDQRNVQVYIYLAVKPDVETGKVDYRAMTDKVLTAGNSAVISSYYTTDLELYVESAKNQRLITSFEDALKEVSIECLINGEEYCRACNPTDSDLYIDDIDRDMKFPDPCAPAEEKKIKAEKIIHNGIEYYYTAEPGMLFDYKIYEFSDELQKYIPLGEDDPLYEEIVDAISAGKK